MRKSDTLGLGFSTRSDEVVSRYFNWMYMSKMPKLFAVSLSLQGGMIL